MPTADNFGFGDYLNENEYYAALTPLPTNSTVSIHGTAATKLNLNPSAQAHQNGRSNPGMFQAYQNALSNPGMLQAHCAPGLLSGPTAGDHGTVGAYYNQDLQARAHHSAISSSYAHEGYYAPAHTFDSTTIDGSKPDTSHYTGLPPHVPQETTSDGYNEQTAPAFTFGSTNNSLWVADNSHYTRPPAQAGDKVTSAPERRHGSDKSPQPAQQVVTVSAVTDSESQSPQDNSRVPELTKFEKWLVCFFTLNGIKNLANITLQILRYRALHSRNNVTRCECQVEDQPNKVGQERERFLQELLGFGGKTAASLHTVQEEARTRVRYLQQLLFTNLDWTIMAERINVGRAFLGHLLYRARTHTLIIAAAVARQEKISFAPIDADFVSGHEQNGTARKKLGRWFELRNIDLREFTSGSEVGPQRDQVDLDGALANPKTPEETERERDFTIMVENAVEMWKLPLYWED